MALHKAICSSPNTPRSHISSCMPAYKAWYSRRRRCLQLRLPCYRSSRRNPVLYLRVSTFPVQCTSVSTCKSKTLPLNMKPFAIAPRTYSSRYRRVGIAPNFEKGPPHTLHPALCLWRGITAFPGGSCTEYCPIIPNHYLVVITGDRFLV